MNRQRVAGFLALAIVLVLLCPGCGDSAGFNDKPVILTDSKGQKYLVRHNIGDTYTVERIEYQP